MNYIVEQPPATDDGVRVGLTVGHSGVWLKATVNGSSSPLLRLTPSGELRLILGVPTCFPRDKEGCLRITESY
jgi:hypothetical protein